MKKIGLVIWLCLVVPCAAQDAMVLRQGEVRADKLWVGAFVHVVYRVDKGKQRVASGYMKAVGRNTFTIGTGIKVVQIAFEKVSMIVLGDSRQVVERQRMMLNVQPRVYREPNITSIVIGQLLLGGALGVGGGYAGALAGMGLDGGKGFDSLDGLVLGGAVGLVVGSALGVALVGNGSFEKSLWGRALAGSLIGFGLGVAVASDSGLWPPLFIAPPVFATVLSWVGNSPRYNNVKINVGLLRTGGQGVSAAYHF
ncbi:MAG: hypothetical protein ACI8V2_001149 [Candidatus Latescibacterota bacterium]|jgi:hypothetical protein